MTINTRIAMLEKTLHDDADVLSTEQAAELNRVIARMRLQVATPVVEPVEQAPSVPALAVTFLTAGKAIFTFAGTTGERYTFKVSKPETNFRGEFFASVMKGSDNENDYQYVGMFNPATMVLRSTKNSKFGADSREAIVLQRAFDIVGGRRELKPGSTLQHAGRCGRCGRTLTVPESIASGFGPECQSLTAAA